MHVLGVIQPRVNLDLGHRHVLLKDNMIKYSQDMNIEIFCSNIYTL